MQLIPEGPEIPEKIQLDLEDNNLVLFLRSRYFQKQRTALVW